MSLLKRLLGGRVAATSLRGYVDVATVMAGTLSRNLLRGLFKFLLFGFLTPQAMGVLRPVFSFFKLVTSLVGFGLDYAMVTLLSSAIRRGEHEDESRILRTVLDLKLVTIAALLVAGNAIAPWITSFVFGDDKFAVYTRLALLAVAGQLLWKYVSSYLSSHQQFGRLAFFLTTVPLFMLVCAIGLIATDRLTVHTGILIVLFAPAAAALVWSPVLDRRVFGGWDATWIRRILGFSRWVYLSSAASAGRNHLNPLLLKNPKLAGSSAVGELNAGLYSFGNDLANEVTVFTQSLMTVLLPKASGKKTPLELRNFVKRSHRHLALLLVPLALLVFAAKPLLLLAGQARANYLEYLPSLGVFKVLYLGNLFSVAAIPMQTALYAMRAPQVETYLEVATVALLIVGALLVIPQHGSEGAALVVFGQRAIYFFSLITIGSIKLRRLEGTVF